MSPVDEDYFIEISNSINNKDVIWYVGCYGIDDLQNLSKLVRKGIIPRDRVKLFRTDVIHVNIKEEPGAEKKSGRKQPKE